MLEDECDVWRRERCLKMRAMLRGESDTWRQSDDWERCFETRAMLG